MKVTTERKKIELEEKEIEYKIEIATQTLERNIGFVNSCDNKTSIVLTIIGVILTIILTNEGLSKIYHIVGCCVKGKSFCDLLYLVYFFAAVFVLLLGLFELARVLVANTTEKTIGRKDESSLIFFSGIRNVGDCMTYNHKFCTMSKEGLLTDLIEQIYINADIASKKYKRYNLGIKCTSIGFALFVAVLIMGVCSY